MQRRGSTCIRSAFGSVLLFDLRGRQEEALDGTAFTTGLRRRRALESVLSPRAALCFFPASFFGLPFGLLYS